MRADGQKAGRRFPKAEIGVPSGVTPYGRVSGVKQQRAVLLDYRLERGGGGGAGGAGGVVSKGRLGRRPHLETQDVDGAVEGTEMACCATFVPAFHADTPVGDGGALGSPPPLGLVRP